MSSDLNTVFEFKLDQTQLKEIQKDSLIRIVKAQVTLFITDLDENNFIERSNEINNLIQTFGQSIREHLLYFLLSDIYKQLPNDSFKVNLLNQHVEFPTEKTESALSFCFALRKFCRLDRDRQLNLENFIKLLHLDPFDKVLLSISLFHDTNDTIIKQAKSILDKNIQGALYTLSKITFLSEHVCLYFVNCFTKALDDNIYEPNTNAISLALMLAKRHHSNQVHVDRLCTMLSISSQRDLLDNLKNMFDIYKRLHNLADVACVEKTLKEVLSHTSFAQILDVMKEKQVFPSILDVLPFHLAIDFVLEANMKKMLDLENWLRQKTQDKDFIQACLDYLSSVFGTVEPDVPKSLSNKVLMTFLKVLSNSPTLPHQVKKIVQLQNQFLLHCPNFTTVIDGLGTPVLEEEVNIYYEHLYSGRLSMDEMIKTLKKTKLSESTREQQLFASLINVLFDEYPFLSKYPEKELTITSILYGQLVQQSILSDTTLEKVLLCLLEALRNPTNTKMTAFGVQAISQFEYRLLELPQFCANLLQLPGFVDSQPRFTSIIRASQRNETCEITNSITCIHLPVLLNLKIPNMPADFNDPDETTRKQVLFVIGGLTGNNIKDKMHELSKLLKSTYYPWFARYLVNTCISSEPSLHDLYVIVLERINSKLLNIHVLHETFSKILVFLNYVDNPPSPTDYALSKHLGSWLGRLTLANDRPILDKHIAFKELLLQGYNTHRLNVIIPLVCKVLEQGQKGKVFIPPNPWLMAILRLLIEMYEFANLSFDLKKEIQALCKSMSVEIKEINMSSIFRRRAVEGSSLDKSQEETETVPIVRNDKPNFVHFTRYMIINPQIPLNATNVTVREWIAQSFIQSLYEICGPTIEYAAKVSAVTTRDMILKDFAKEKDESKMKRAAYSMIQALSANLVLTLTNQSLEVIVAKNLRRTLLALELNNTIVEKATLLIVADNSSLLKSTVQKMAMDRATEEIDIILSSDFANRKTHRDQWPDRPFVDFANQSQHAHSVPWKLQPNQSDLQSSQLTIYEELSTSAALSHSSFHFASTSTSNTVDELDSMLSYKRKNDISGFSQDVLNEDTRKDNQSGL